jgi:hypothetical protein
VQDFHAGSPRHAPNAPDEFWRLEAKQLLNHFMAEVGPFRDRWSYQLRKARQVTMMVATSETMRLQSTRS